MSRTHALIAANLGVLAASERVLEALDDTSYRNAIGPQTRHVLEFYECFFAGIDAGRIDYEARPRDARIETSRAVALQRSRRTARALAGLAGHPGRSSSRILFIRAESGPAPDDGSPATSDEWSPSSIARELEFLLSHTVHHQALIAEILRARGVAPDTDFGVAPSTLQHRNRLALAS